MISADQVADLYNERSKAAGVEQQVLREITDLYQGDIAVPLPELGANEAPSVPNIARAGIDQIGQRIASGFPEIEVRPSSPSKRSISRAGQRRRAFYAFHEQEKTARKMRRRSRYLMGYASAPVRLSVDFENMRPRWEVRSPVGMYAAPTRDPDEMVPTDCIFATRQTMGWLQRRHPTSYGRLFRDGDTPSTEIDVIEYVDPEVVWVLACRRSYGNSDRWNLFDSSPSTPHSASEFAPIAMYPNRTGRTLVATPGQITLGARRSPYHQIKGMYQAAAEMDAWARHATAKGINPETWFLGINGEDPRIIQAADALNNIPGQVADAQIFTNNIAPQFAARAAISDLERAERLTAQLPAELGGEAASNVRTGRRSDQLLSAVLDFPIQEAHHLFEESIELENEMAAAIDLHYFRNVPKVWSVNYAGEKGDLSYTPGDLWTKNGDGKTESFRNNVSYFAAGVDVQDRIIAMGQRLGMGTISQETVMRNDPMVDDVEGEKSKITNEALTRAVLAKVEVLANDPASPLTMSDVITLKRHVAKGDSIEEAWDKVEKAIAERQAEQQAPGPDPTAGIAEPAAGAGPGGPIAPAPEGVKDLTGLLNGLRAQSAFAGPQG